MIVTVTSILSAMLTVTPIETEVYLENVLREEKKNTHKSHYRQASLINPAGATHLVDIN